jgi:phosphoadenosine phosphosulfate reductase
MIFNVEINKIYNNFKKFEADDRLLFMTSSFQTQSLVLLKIISGYKQKIPIYFIDTGYHFPETIEYKNYLQKYLKIHIIDISPNLDMLYQLNSNNRLLFTSNTDRCCEINKTKPLNRIMNMHDVWITGIRHDQTNYRKNTTSIQHLQNGKIKYNPIIEWTQNNVQEFIQFFNLPKHPLDNENISSIGCQPCTRIDQDQKRESSRWPGQAKTECGLHLNYMEN